MTIKIFKISLIILLFLTLVKTDYRLVDEIDCCSDDFEYFIHAQTIAIDRDFDYSNQILDTSKARFSYNNKIAPAAFVGSGILSAPFYFVGSVLNNYFPGGNKFNFVILFYSLSSIVYLLLAFLLVYKSIQIINSKVNFDKLLIIFFGTGLSYYAFERYSMTHIYEVFSSALLIFLTLQFSKKYKLKIVNLYATLIPLAILIGILCRWTNYYLLVLPLLINAFYLKKFGKGNILYKNKLFYFSIFICILIFIGLSKLIYGVVTFNPQFVYSSNRLEGFIELSSNFFITNIKNFILVMFGNEFGILWTAPCIAFCIILVFIHFFRNKQKSLDFITLLIFAQVLSVVLIWETTASSYGFRYLYSIIPFSIFYIYYVIEDFDQKNISKVLYIFSVFGFISYLFFETTSYTQLISTPITNSFGKVDVPYSQPEYLTGVLRSLLIPEAYLKILANGFLAAFIIKLFIYFFNYGFLLETLFKFNLPVENKSFLNNVSNVISTDFVNILLFLVLNVILITLFLSHLNRNSPMKKKNNF